ncbi:hypothetical protein SESBI_40149 [Sesbania bispinosa]|nr:hypothetical protein SESBI_40149 [Sesbania bispinosa]
MLVNVYVSIVIDGAQAGVAMQPIYVACSTSLGALASVLAMLLPYPRLTYYEARKFYRLYIKNTSERLNCNIEAISATDNSTAAGFLTQAKCLSTAGAKLLLSMGSKLVVMNLIPSNHNLAFAFKSSLSLGLAVLFGLIYDKENGYWHSRMYGQAGGISAVIGALLILGRKHYGPPSHFAVARITEATIGLICYIIVEILLSPARAATLAKSELSQSLRSLRDCIGQIAIITPSERDMATSSYQALREGQKKLKSLVCQLQEFTAEAELEPNFWFLPFHSSCYSKMLESLSRMVDLLLFMAYSMEHASQLSQKDGVFWMELQDRVNENVKEYPNADAFKILSGDEEVNSITSSFLRHLEEMANKTNTNKDEEMLKVRILFHYSCLGFCTSNLMRETIKIESEVKELLIWENPSSQTNFKEIYCKINTLHSQLAP